MILTPLAMRRGSYGLTQHRDGSKGSSTPSRRPSQLLDVPRLDLNTVDQEKKIQLSSHDLRKSFSSSNDSRRTDASFPANIPASGDTLLKSQSVSLEMKDDDEREKKPETGAAVWFSRLKLILWPHLTLATVVIVYTLIGAAVFYVIERPYESDYKTQIIEKIHRLRDEYLDRMWNMTQNHTIDDKQFMDQGVQELETVLRETIKAFEDGVTDAALNNGSLDLAWTYTEAVLFSATVITTIGYGNLVPKTIWGRILCIIYALLGIPLTLVTIADIGKFVGSGITWSYEQIIFARDTTINSCRVLISRLNPHQRISKRQSVIIARRQLMRRRSSAWIGKEDPLRRLSAIGHGESKHQSRRQSLGSELKQNNNNDALLEGIAEEEPRSENQGQQDGVKRDLEDRKQSGGDDSDDEGEEVEDDIPVPPSFVLLIVVGYTALSSFLFAMWENWMYLDAFYFCLITVTTVGFGDLVPSADSNAAFVLLFIFFGLILATMCIDMVGTHYISKIHYMGRKLQDAKAALALIGGKAVNMTAWTKQLKVMQRQYGMTDEQMRRLMENPEEYTQLMEAARLGTKSRASLRAYIPRGASRMKYIDQNGGTISEYTPTTPSQAAELLALSSARSTVLTRTSL